MAIELVTKFAPYTDEIFHKESKKSLLTNNDFEWTGAHTVKVFKVTSSGMNDYGRNGPAAGNWSRYGAVGSLDATTEEMTLTKDRSFTFAIDKLDRDETLQQVPPLQLWHGSSVLLWFPRSIATCTALCAPRQEPRRKP